MFSRLGRPASSLATALAALIVLVAPMASARADAPPAHGGMAVSPGKGNQTTPMIMSLYGVYPQMYWSDDRDGSPRVWGAETDSSASWKGTFALVDYSGYPPVGAHTLAAVSSGNSPWTVWLDGTSNFDLTASTMTTPNAVGWGNPFHVEQICTAAGDQVAPCVVGDVNSAVVAWQDGRAGAANIDIYAQYVWASPAPPPPPWTTNGVQLCNATGNQQSPASCSDGSSGAIVAWVDYRSGTADIYAQRVNGSGVIQWGVAGRPVCTVPLAQTSVQIVSDGAGGAILAWSDGRNGNADIYVQRLNSAGTPLWTVNGVAVCTTAGDQNSPLMRADGSGGACLAWVDSRVGQDIYANRIDASGVLQWGDPLYGAPVCTAPGAQTSLQVAANASAFYLTWEDRRGATADVYAQVLPFNGMSWATDGVPVCVAPGEQTAPVIAVDLWGGATIAWQDARVPLRPQIYAQRLRANGVLVFPDTDRPKITSVRDVPGDQGGNITLSFGGGGLDNSIARSITGFQVWRRVTPSAAVMASTAIEGAGADLPRGRFLARRAGPEASAATSYWESVATLPAHQLAGYAYTAATTRDSAGGTNPYTAFFVSAQTADPYSYYDSEVDSSYSVDNLAPAMISSFTGFFTGGATALHWAKSTDPDFAVYRIHRDSSPDFVMGPGNLVTEQPDTGYVDAVALRAGGASFGTEASDATGPYYYKLVAVDVHGNVSPAAVLAPRQTNAVGGVTPGRLWLASPSPNPARRNAAIAYGLAREGDVALEVFDVRGARVRRLVSEQQAAGDHVARWDGRDDDGARMASGVYFYRLTTGEGALSHRLVLAD